MNTLFFLMSAITTVLADVKGHLFSNADVSMTSLVTLTIYWLLKNTKLSRNALSRIQSF